MDVQEGGAIVMAPSSNDGIMLMSKAIEDKVGDDIVTSSLVPL